MDGAIPSQKSDNDRRWEYPQGLSFLLDIGFQKATGEQSSLTLDRSYLRFWLQYQEVRYMSRQDLQVG